MVTIQEMMRLVSAYGNACYQAGRGAGSDSTMDRSREKLYDKIQELIERQA